MSCERHTIAVKGNYKLIDVNYGGQRMDYNYEKERQEAIDAGNRASLLWRAAVPCPLFEERLGNDWRNAVEWVKSAPN